MIVMVASIVVLGLVYHNNLDLKLKTHEFFAKKYARMFKNKLSKKFTQQQLQAAIAYLQEQAWCQDQIKEDLVAFHALTNEKVRAWYQKCLEADPTNLNHLALFEIKNGQVSIQVAPERKSHRSYKMWNELMTYLATNRLVPETVFIVVLEDFLVKIPEFFKTVPVNARVPMFGFARDNERAFEKNIVLVPDWMNLAYWEVLKARIEFASLEIPWEKKIQKLHWRGGLADGMGHRKKMLALQTQDKQNFLDIYAVEGEKKVPFVTPEFSLKYKYQLALDGARATWERIIWQMQSNAVMIKPHSSHLQWFHKALEPYKNYVPMEDTTPEEVEKLRKWLLTHDAQAKQIALNATDFAKKDLSTEAAVAYYVLLLNEYAKLFQ